ncbi:MAG: preprotein translocase subunit SecA [Candidatus Cloacimonetes bacterium 4572_65]|nr:MAG: preprotein translocase subunit SecA [Candidatus Cloacimonetes bacterium 4572_65]
MFEKLLKKIFGDKQEKVIKNIYPIINDINEVYKTLENKSDDEIKARIEEIKDALQTELQKDFTLIDTQREAYITEIDETKKDGLSNQLDETKKRVKEKVQTLLDDHLVEVFAIVRDTCRRLLNHTYDVRGNDTVWNMVPYDVQLIGGVILHQGKITEMATGEGKTLVATLPLFLNALIGKGAHLVTVNDYLAQRDAEWMSPIFEFHGMRIGCIVNGMSTEQKKDMYSCDVTYGMNSEFGFDYLRDNMAVHAEQLVQRDFYYAIVDEVDSILIDEARTPLIISGSVDDDKNFYNEIKPHIERLFKLQDNQAKEISTTIREMLKDDNSDSNELGRLLVLLKHAAPKSKAFVKFMKENDLKKLCIDVEGRLLSDKKISELNSEIFYSIDEKANTIELSEKGQNVMNSYEEDLFIVTTLDELLQDVESNESLSAEHRLHEVERVTTEYMDKSEKQHNIKQLLKAYSLFEKEKEYVVMDNQVQIVDEFTGRLMPGRRFSDGLHQALEAKERVKIQKASQTLATITLQNYFRMFDKLAGMTGTAVTEEGEFQEIYELPVVEVPTNVPITRNDHEDAIYLSRNEKYKAIIKEIEYWHELNKPVLVGTTSVDVSEALSRMLRRRKIVHSVLNAKNHQQEADIVASAGQAGAVTIATNMAGRGTDIKIAPEVITREHEYYNTTDGSITKELPYGGPVDGLHVIGSERHESRRIDRQLRGRAGRQGDPGTSRFYLSLEDDLMRLFGSDRIAPMMMKLGAQEDDPIIHPWMTKAVSKAQKRVEEHNFEIRKNLIKYDEVMTAQREIIYQYRRNVLRGYDLKNEIVTMFKDTLHGTIDNLVADPRYPDTIEIEEVCRWIKINLAVPVDYSDFDNPDLDTDALRNELETRLVAAYDKKEDIVGIDNQRELERRSLLETVDTNWREHLREMDHLQEGISLRAYGNKDPLIEYKKESYNIFETMVFRIQEQVSKKVFTRVLVHQANLEDVLDKIKTMHNDSNAFGNVAKEPQAQEKPQMPQINNRASNVKPQPMVNNTKVGRNEPCPCGSGKKYKKCCGKNSTHEEE